ncbi:hypothetical protein L596_018220 [Steinernema carpocapsae]|uniref:Uncharacterized protein n=1 Tax=Steinernema carpocapsae TaxID=34508 RepID=A0A4U5N406_STECR|nr:hypothetical protein L596_018220 [Steinernema carpocapsae]
MPSALKPKSQAAADSPPAFRLNSQRGHVAADKNPRDRKDYPELESLSLSENLKMVGLFKQRSFGQLTQRQTSLFYSASAPSLHCLSA